MTETIQSVSPVLVKTAKTQYALFSSIPVNSEKPASEKYMGLVPSLNDTVNNLCCSLEKLDYLLRRKMTELETIQQQKERQK